MKKSQLVKGENLHQPQLCTNNTLVRELKNIPLESIVIDEACRVYEPSASLGLNASLDEMGQLEPITVLDRNDGTFTMLNGHNRFHHLMLTKDGAFNVLAWVIDADMTELEIKKLILDLSRGRRKSYSDMLREFDVYDQIIPNNQGKSGVASDRRQVNADWIGISKSQLNKLLRIRAAEPSFLTAVDNGEMAIGKAEKAAILAKSKKAKKENQFASESVGSDLIANQDTANPELDDMVVNAISNRRIRNIDVDLESHDCLCPTCKRPYAWLEWDQIPFIFNVGRDKDIDGNDWLDNVA